MAVADPVPAPSQICGIIVTYFPDAQCAPNWLQVSRQVGGLVFVDDGTPLTALQPTMAAAAEIGASCIHMEANRGIAATLNAGLAAARKLGFRWAASFDQDSCPEDNMIRNMCLPIRSRIK